MKRFLSVVCFVLYSATAFAIDMSNPSCNTCAWVSGSLLQYMQLTGLYTVTVEQVKNAGKQYCQQETQLVGCLDFVEKETERLMEWFRDMKTNVEGDCVQWGYCGCEAGTGFINDGAGGACLTCSDGKYSLNDGSNTCASCISPGTTSDTYGKTSLFDCYIPKGSSFSDENGEWKYSDNCFYK